MSNKQNNKKEQKVYTSFNELAQEVYGLPSYTKQIQNNGKRTDAKQKFEKFNTCKTCGQPMSYLGGNVVCCTNPDCKKKPFRLLDEKNKNFAQSVFGEV